MGKHQQTDKINGSLQYWRPPGDRLAAGDCMPFVHDGVFHLYYLLDVNHHNHPEVGWLGGHSWAHASSRDLVNWEHHPPALPVDFAKGDASHCTGSLVADGGRVYAFYALRSRRYPGEERLRRAVSVDGGITFRLNDRDIADAQSFPAAWDSRQFRDPFVFRDGDGQWNMLVSTQSADMADGIPPIGGLARLVSADLETWRPMPGWYAQTALVVPECADYFEWQGDYYLLHGRDFATVALRSANAHGPWRRTSIEIPACPRAAVMKTAPWGSGRRIGVAWIGDVAPDGCAHWGGRTLFRELIRLPDGALGTSFVPEMTPAAAEIFYEAASVRLAGRDRYEVWPLPVPPPGDHRIQLSCRPQAPHGRCGLVWLDGRGQPVRRLEWDIASRRVEWSFTRPAPANAIGGIDWVPGRPMAMDIIAKGELVDVCLAGTRTLAGNHAAAPGRTRVCLYAAFADAEWTGLRLAAL